MKLKVQVQLDDHMRPEFRIKRRNPEITITNAELGVLRNRLLDLEIWERDHDQLKEIEPLLDDPIVDKKC